LLYNSIKHILPQFQFQGNYANAVELQSGNINGTYLLTYKFGTHFNRYILQHVNNYVFKNPEGVMRNIELVTRHLKSALIANGEDPTRRVLEIIPTRDGKAMYVNDGYWRAYRYIDNATAYDAVEKPVHFQEAGRAFGEFQRLLCDFPTDELYVTIPDFHNTTRRFYAFVQAVAEDKAGRVKFLEPEIEFFFEHRKMMNEIVRQLDSGALPWRVTHNDTKLNNVMIDNSTDKAVCVIDLDTIMPGSSLYDFGDAIRFGANTAREDEEDLSLISLDMERFALFTRGFLSEVDGFLTDAEIRLLPLGAKIITCELAMRFLTDYIDGDLYFKVKSPMHNLIRTRAQMRLLEDMEQKTDQMERIIESLRK